LLSARVYTLFRSYLALQAPLFILPLFRTVDYVSIFTLIAQDLLLPHFVRHLASAFPFFFTRLTPQTTRLRLKQLNKPGCEPLFASLKGSCCCLFSLVVLFLLVFSCGTLLAYYLLLLSWLLGKFTLVPLKLLEGIP
jgi:hypothetical protein